MTKKSQPIAITPTQLISPPTTSPVEAIIHEIFEHDDEEYHSDDNTTAAAQKLTSACKNATLDRNYDVPRYGDYQGLTTLEKIDASAQTLEKLTQTVKTMQNQLDIVTDELGSVKVNCQGYCQVRSRFISTFLRTNCTG